MEQQFCTVCEASTQSRAIPLVDHTLEDWVLTQEPLCSRVGIETKFCQFCDFKEERHLPMIAHTYKEWVITVPPSCLGVGVKAHTCTNCSHTETATADPTGHAFGDYILAVKATLRAEGREDAACASCDAVSSRPIPKKDINLSTILPIGVCTLMLIASAVFFVTAVKKQRK
jgi:hypothetical protein